MAEQHSPADRALGRFRSATACTIMRTMGDVRTVERCMTRRWLEETGTNPQEITLIGFAVHGTPSFTSVSYPLFKFHVLLASGH